MFSFVILCLGLKAKLALWTTVEFPFQNVVEEWIAFVSKKRSVFVPISTQGCVIDVSFPFSKFMEFFSWEDYCSGLLVTSLSIVWMYLNLIFGIHLGKSVLGTEVFVCRYFWGGLWLWHTHDMTDAQNDGNFLVVPKFVRCLFFESLRVSIAFHNFFLRSRWNEKWKCKLEELLLYFGGG